MRPRKFKFVLVAMLVASGLLFAGGEARAAFSYQLQNANSVNTDTSATYTYTVTIAPGSTQATYVNFAVPVGVCLKEGQFAGAGVTGATCSIPPSMSSSTGGYSLGGSFSVAATGGATITGGEVFPAAIGDFGSKFGYGDTSIRVLKASFGTVPTSTPFTLTLTLSGQSFTPAVDQTQYVFGTDPGGVVLLKASQGTNTLSFMTETPEVVVKPVIPPPVVIIDSLSPNNFVMTATGMKPSSCALLTWHSSGDTTGGFTIAANPGETISLPTGSTSATVCPAVPLPGPVATTTYTITATGASGTSAPDSASVTVVPLTQVSANSLCAKDPTVVDPSPCVKELHINPGVCPKLEYSTSDASFAFISNITASGTQGGLLQGNLTSGTITLTGVDCPVFDVSYQLTAIRWNGTQDNPDDGLVTVFINADPLSATPPTASDGLSRTPTFIDGWWYLFLRDKYARLVDVEVCGDDDYNNGTINGQTTNPPTPPNTPCEPGSGFGVTGLCCSLHMAESNDVGFRRCFASGGGPQECTILGSSSATGTPHSYTQTSSSGITTKRYYCNPTTENKVAGSYTPAGFECFRKSDGGVHTD